MRSEADNKGAGLETHSRDIELGHVSLRGEHCNSDFILCVCVMFITTCIRLCECGHTNAMK